MLEEHAAFLCLREMDLEVHEAILVDELERGLHPSDGLDLSIELDKSCACVDRTTNDCAIEGDLLSRQVVRVADVLVDLGLLPAEDIP
jgi:hypothetical protein